MAEDSENEEFERIPGLFRSWDLMQVLVGGESYQVMEAGATREGAPLFAVYLAVRPAMAN